MSIFEEYGAFNKYTNKHGTIRLYTSGSDSEIKVLLNFASFFFFGPIPCLRLRNLQ